MRGNIPAWEVWGGRPSIGEGGEGTYQVAADDVGWMTRRGGFICSRRGEAERYGKGHCIFHTSPCEGLHADCGTCLEVALQEPAHVGQVGGEKQVTVNSQMLCNPRGDQPSARSKLDDCQGICTCHAREWRRIKFELIGRIAIAAIEVGEQDV